MNGPAPLAGGNGKKSCLHNSCILKKKTLIYNPFSCVCRCRRVQWPPGEESGVPQTAARALSGTSYISATLRKLRLQPNQFGLPRDFPPSLERLRRLATLRKHFAFPRVFPPDFGCSRLPQRESPLSLRRAAE